MVKKYQVVSEMVGPSGHVYTTREEAEQAVDHDPQFKVTSVTPPYFVEEIDVSLLDVTVLLSNDGENGARLQAKVTRDVYDTFTRRLTENSDCTLIRLDVEDQPPWYVSPKSVVAVTAFVQEEKSDDT